MFGPQGQFTVRPNMGDLMTDKNLFFKADPYCVFLFGDQRAMSSVCKKGGKRPIWNDAIIFKRTAEENLLVQLWDKDKLSKDDLIAEGSLKVTNLFEPGVHQTSIDLFCKGKLIGKLLIETEFTPGLKVMPQATDVLLSSQPMTTSGNRF